MTDLSIRTALPEEAPRLTEFAARAKASWGYDAAFTEQYRTAFTPAANQTSSVKVWVAENDSQLAEMITLSLDNDSAEVEDFVVEREFRGLGVGRALMDTIFAECGQLGITNIELTADPAAEPIYRKPGFVTAGCFPAGWFSARPVRRMVRPVF